MRTLAVKKRKKIGANDSVVLDAAKNNVQLRHE
jgi:hypothetical protein